MYSTEFNDVFIENVLINQAKKPKELISILKEEEAEFEFNYNKTGITSNIEERCRFIKVRRLNKAMGENLKVLYNYKCQICGTNFSINHD